MILAGIFGNLIAAAVCIAFVMIRSLIDHHSTNVWGMNVWETFAPVVYVYSLGFVIPGFWAASLVWLVRAATGDGKKG